MTNDILDRLRQTTDLHRRRLLLAAYVCSEVSEQGTKPVLVGGNAVEFYTFSQYTTHDIDLVASQRHLVGAVLEKLGFVRKKGARHWFHQALDLAVEIPDHALAGDMDRSIEVEIDGWTATIISIEDLLVDRLQAHIRQDSVSDFEQALTMYSLHYAEIDSAYLKQQVIKHRLEQGLRELQEQLVLDDPKD